MVLKVRSYLRTRAGLPPVTVGNGILNQGHRSLYERELVFLHEILPKDAVVHDGLQLRDGADVRRHLVPAEVGVVAATLPSTVPVASVPAATGSALPGAQAGAVNPSSSLQAGVVNPSPSLQAGVVNPSPSLPDGVVLPTPPNAVRLAPLPPGFQVLPGSQAAREEERQRQDCLDDEEDDEIRPVSDDYAAQWRAYNAARRC